MSAIGIRSTSGTVEVAISREQAERCLAALLERPYAPHADEQENVECFLIVQFRAALGTPMPADHWMVKRADRV